MVMKQRQSLSDPGQDGFVVTPANTNFSDNRQACALWVGTGGAGTLVEVVTVTGATLPFYNPPSGSIIPICCKQVTTNTTATNIVALF